MKTHREPRGDGRKCRRGCSAVSTPGGAGPAWDSGSPGEWEGFSQFGATGQLRALLLCVSQLGPGALCVAQARSLHRMHRRRR